MPNFQKKYEAINQLKMPYFHILTITTRDSGRQFPCPGRDQQLTKRALNERNAHISRQHVAGSRSQDVRLMNYACHLRTALSCRAAFSCSDGRLLQVGALTERRILPRAESALSARPCGTASNAAI
jgi:hypothetical protein